MDIQKKPCVLPHLSHLDIYEDGRIYNNKTKKFCTWIKHNQGYNCISAYSEESGEKTKFKKYLVQRLVAITFIGQIPEKYIVNHIDGNKKNNHVQNLEIITESENLTHAYKIGLRKITEKQKENFKKNAWVYAKETFGNKIFNSETNEIYLSQRECALKLNISRYTLARSLKNGNKIFPHLIYLKEKQHGE